MLNEMSCHRQIRRGEKSRYSSGKTKLFVFLFLAGSIIPNLLFAQFTQQGPKLVGQGQLEVLAIKVHQLPFLQTVILLSWAVFRTGLITNEYFNYKF
jgi:hypothetical protein